MKKGIYFTIDSIVASGVILIVIVLASSFYAKEQPIFHVNYLSQDLIETLSVLTVEEIDNEYINSLIDDGTITNPDNTVLEQIVEFWDDDNIILANKTTSNVTEPLIPVNMGFGLWINNESIYERNVSVEKSLVSSKKIISGMLSGQETRKNPPRLLGPVVAEVRVWQ